jgi:hypothetical protein
MVSVPGEGLGISHEDIRMADIREWGISVIRRSEIRCREDPVKHCSFASTPADAIHGKTAE